MMRVVFSPRSLSMLFALSALCLGLPACDGGGDGDGDGDAGTSCTDEFEVCHDRDLQTIWEANCTECHSMAGDQDGFAADIMDWPFEMWLTEGDAYANLVNVDSAQATSLKLVAPGDPDNSYLLAKLKDEQDAVGGDGDPMPNAWEDTAMTMLKLGNPLPAAQIADVEQWIADGAPE